jgi:hypothetical protein
VSIEEGERSGYTSPGEYVRMYETSGSPGARILEGRERRMDTSTAIVLFLLFVTLFLWLRRRHRNVIAVRMMRRKRQSKREERIDMEEMARRFIGKNCTLQTFDSNAITGELLEVTAGAVLVRGKDGQEAAVNLDFILKILEVPEKKKKR